MVNQNSVPPWYKQFWPWFLLSIPVASVILSMLMISLAITRPHSMVSDDYYKDGLAINQDLSKDTAAIRLNISASAHTDHESKQQQVLLSGLLPDTNYDYLLLKLEHPTLPVEDKLFQLIPSETHHYSNYIDESIEGKRYVTLTPADDSWRLTGEVEFPLTHVKLTPKPVQGNRQP